MRRAREQGLSLTGPDGLLKQLTKVVLETALDQELTEHLGHEKNAPADGRLLRYTDGRPVTYRRYDGLWARIGRHLPWARTQQVTTHWLRHTTLTS